MSLGSFLNQLLDTGNVVVAESQQLESEDLSASQRLLQEMDRQARQEMPGSPPEFDIEAAAWAAAMLYKGCQLLAYRDIPAEAIPAFVDQPCPKQLSPEVVYSVDLTFRFLPELLDLARGLAPGDPLVEGIKRLCQRWPLSSVGVGEIGQVDIGPFVNNACLRQLYVDRILSRGDMSRAEDVRVQGAIKASIGLYENLCPDLANTVKKDLS